MYGFLTAILLLLAASPVAAQTCCCCGAGAPGLVNVPDPAIWRAYDGNGKLALNPNGSVITDTDGQAGLACSGFNRAAYRSWKNLGGDWVDANNTPQGSVPFHSLAIGVATNATIEITATSLLNADGIVLRNTNGQPVRFGSRENPSPAYRPKLVVTLADNSVQELDPTADAAMFKTGGACDSTATGKNETMSLGHAIIIVFPAPPATAVSAKLRMTVISSMGNTTLQLFAMKLPKVALEPRGVGDPTAKTYYYEPWEASDWWTRTGGVQVPDAQWTGDRNAFKRPNQSGMFFADGGPPVLAQGTTSTMVARGTGYKGVGLLAIHHPTCLACGVELENANLLKLRPRVGEPAEEMDEAWLTYYVKFGTDWGPSGNCEGGKMPGLSGYTDICSNSSISGNGFCGWSLRNGYGLVCDPSNPAYGKVSIHTYAYHGLQPGFYGQWWVGNELTLLDKGKWYCLEQHVKVNTPGVADGINDVYINGQLAISKRDVYLRGVKPAQGYGDWRLFSQYPASQNPQALTAPQITDAFGRKLWLFGAGNAPTNLGIRKAFMAIHNGGRIPWGKTATQWFDEFRLTDKRYGCE